MSNALPRIGAQLIIFGGHLDIETQTDEILDSLVEAGYDAVEGGPREALPYRRKLDERGLVYAGSHAGLAGGINVPHLVEYQRIMGSQDVCNSGLLKWGELKADDYVQAIEKLNEAGRQLRDNDLRFHYHNHAFEFDPLGGGKTGMDLLLEGLDPQAVDLCVDVAWVQKGGHDPAEFLHTHQDRIGYLHFKDFDGDRWVPLGQGKVNWQPIMDVLPKLTRVRSVVIEQDSTQGDPRADMAVGRRFLRDTFGY